jgi:hypothetical protein
MPTPVKCIGVSLLFLLSLSLSCGHDQPPVAGRKVEVSIKGKTLTVKDLDKDTTLTCECPCNVSFDKDPVKYSC